MATRLKEVDVVIVGLGWTGGILAKELSEAGMSVVALERGVMRTTNPDFSVPLIRDELRYVVRHALMQNPARDTLTFRNRQSDTALPMRQLGSFLPGEGVGGAGRPLERRDLALDRDRSRAALALRAALRQGVHSCRHAGPRLADVVQGARAVLRPLRTNRGRQRQGRQPARRAAGRGQRLRSPS